MPSGDCILQNNAGFCATSNEIHIIDDDENRRFLIRRIEKIKSPIDFPFNYEGIYSQAVALAQEVIEKRRRVSIATGFTGLRRRRTRRFSATIFISRVNNYIAERINKFYRVPDADTPSEFCKFVTASDVMERICTNPAFRQSMSNKDISMFMEALGFKKIHRKTGNGWKVIEMRPDEIENNPEDGWQREYSARGSPILGKFCFGDIFFIFRRYFRIFRRDFLMIRRDFILPGRRKKQLTKTD